MNKQEFPSSAELEIVIGTRHALLPLGLRKTSLEQSPSDRIRASCLTWAMTLQSSNIQTTSLLAEQTATLALVSSYFTLLFTLFASGINKGNRWTPGLAMNGMPTLYSFDMKRFLRNIVICNFLVEEISKVESTVTFWKSLARSK